MSNIPTFWFGFDERMLVDIDKLKSYHQPIAWHLGVQRTWLVLHAQEICDVCLQEMRRRTWRWI
jgi:hypothetical protein